MPIVTFITKTASPKRIIMDSFHKERNMPLMDGEMILCNIYVRDMDEACIVKGVLWRAIIKIKREGA